ncbi:kelch-like protein 10 [Misgurnus anguillicaudatus]|uniref:kelch-like protein 10 n=1 Tax=Misgurnus anguillicaudatus TaxID=75329 RepID=UPI003CCFCB02
MENETNFTAFSVFDEVRLDGEHTDAIIRVKDTEFKVHKIILCGCSPYFRALFSTKWSNGQHFYEISDMSPQIMSLIIQHAYTRSVPITEENVQELLVVADRILIKDLVDACCGFLESQLCPENCIGIFMFTEHFHSCSKLHEKAKFYILEHFKNVVGLSQELQELPLKHLEELIGRDELNIKEEEIVFEAILRWIEHDPQERKIHIATLLPKIRMGLMTSEYYQNNVKSNPLVTDDEFCSNVINSATNALYNLNISEISSQDLRKQLMRPRLPPTVLLAIGGWSTGGPTNKIEAYDVRADCWVNVTPEVDTPRAYHETVVLDGFVFCIGGFDGVNYFNSVRKFDITNQTWHEVAPMYERRCYVSVTVLDGHIYAMGGYDGNIRLNSAERYDPKTNQWSLIASMNEHRSDASAITLHGKVYICGGFSGNDCHFTAEVFDPQTNQWSFIAPMMNRRSGLGVISYGNRVYAVGGFDGADRLRSVERYNPDTDSWRAIEPMITPRSNFGIEVLEDRIYAVGGFNGSSTTDNVECFNWETNYWYEVCDMTISRSALSCCILSGLPEVIKYTANRDSLPTGVCQ